LTLLIIGLAGASLATVNLLSFQFTTLFGSNPAYVSRLLLASGFSVWAGIILGNWSLDYFGGANREILSASAFIMAVGFGTLATVTENTPALAVGLSFLGGFGAGGIVQPATTMLTIISSDELIGTIIAIALSVRIVGESIGFTIYDNVLTNKLADILPVNVGDAAITAGLPYNQITTFLGTYFSTNSSALAQYSPLILQAAQEATTTSYVVGFRLIYLISIAFGGSAVVGSLFLGDIRKHMVNRVAVDIH